MIIEMTPTGIASTALPCALGTVSFGAAVADRIRSGR